MPLIWYRGNSRAFCDIIKPVLWESTRVYEACPQGSIMLVITLLLIFLQPAHAHGGHMHLSGVFFLLLGGVAFMSGLCTVFYLLLRPEPEETHIEKVDDRTAAPEQRHR
jgi:hypothetical protein